MQLTPTQLNLLRSRPHQANLFLSIYRPKTLMSAQVMTGTYNTGDIQINYMNVATGSYSNLYADLTVLVGTAPGGDDYGRIRMRSATGTYIVFAENAINWNTGLYLTFIDQIDVQAIYPRIIQNPNNPTDVIFYKDYNIPYSNQNSIYGTFVNAGPHRAGFISSGTFYFTASGTYNVLSEALTYSWIFEGGTPTGSTAHTPGNVRWNATGDYKVILQVTSASGAVDTTYRYVSIYDRPNRGNHPPILQWELTQFSGSRSEGGYTASFKVYQDLGEIQPNAIVVLFSDNFYGGTRSNLGGNALNNSSIFFVGYIIGDSIQFDYQSSSVEFSVGSITEIMKQAEGFSVSCESKASPSTWFELYEMNVPRALYHYLRWHSTILKVADFQYTGDARFVQYFDADRGSLYDAIDSFVRDGMLGEVITDRQGKLWAEVSSFGLLNPITSIPTNFVLQKSDWHSTPQINERRNSELSFIELGGIAYYGVSSNTFSALLSNAPSTVPLYHGKSDRKEGLILSSQQDLNQITGNYLAHFNTRFSDISTSLVGIYTNMDIVPLEKYYLVIDQNDTVRDKSIQDLPYVVSSMDWKYSAVNQSLYPDISLMQIVTGTAGVTVEIPVTPPDNGYSYPSLQLPPLPDFPSTGGVGSTIPMVVIFWDRNMGLVYTDDFDSGSPHYITINGGLTAAQYQNINFMFVCPNGAFYVGRCDVIANAQRGTGRATSPFIARASSVGAPFTIIEDENTLWAKYPTYSTLNHAIKACTFNPLVAESVTYIMGEDTSTLDQSDFDIWIGSAGSYAKGAHVTRIDPNHGFNGLSYSQKDAQWVYTGPRAQLFNPAAVWKFNFNASSLVSADGATFGDISEYSHIRAGTTQILYTLGLSSGDIRKSTDNGNTWNLIGNTALHSGDGMSVEPSLGQQVMLQYSVGNRGRSSDGLATVSTLGTLPPSARYVFGYAGSGGSSVSDSRWIAAYSILRFSPDFGSTWLNKEGNYFTNVTIVPAIYMIFVPGISQNQSQQNAF